MMGRMPRTDWRSRALLAVIALQIAVPLVALVGSDPPTRFGFQMYSGLGGVDVQIRDRDGEPMAFDLHATLADLARPELDWTTRLPAYLCTRVPGAATVTVRQGDEESTATCD
jgi:hypothetical protein